MADAGEITADLEGHTDESATKMQAVFRGNAARREANAKPPPGAGATPVESRSSRMAKSGQPFGDKVRRVLVLVLPVLVLVVVVVLVMMVLLSCSCSC